jgi:hypothetical protein
MIDKGSYINAGDTRRSMCTVYKKGIPGPLMQFRESTLIALRLNGLLDSQNKITDRGEIAAIKGYYEINI